MILEKKAPAKSILITVSDGGPDHRVTFLSVKLALIALFRALDLRHVSVSSHMSPTTVGQTWLKG